MSKQKVDTEFKVTIVSKPDQNILDGGMSGLLHLDSAYHNLNKHPDIAKYRPQSAYGSSYLAKFDKSDYFAWIKPVAGGQYRSTDPVFLVEKVL